MNIVEKKTNDTNKIIFTNDQQIAIDELISFIGAPFDEHKYIMGLTGAGGTGKTFIINYIINNCKYSPSVIKCTSPTHKACRVFSAALKGKTVNTIQSTFGLRLDLKLEDFDPLNPQFNPMATPKLENTKLLFIDEASMLPAKLVTYICNTCKKENIKIIFIGDAYQLPPVNEKKSIAFDRCYKVFQLNQIVRQKDKNPIKDLLNILREDIKNNTYNFISYINNNLGINNYNYLGDGYSIVNETEFKNLININFSNKDYTKNIDLYRIIAYKNVTVSYWNNYIRQNIIKDANINIITKNDLIMSNETIVDEFLEPIIYNSEEYIIHDIINYTDSQYNFKGFLVRFQLIQGGTITKPLFILDHKDNYTILKYNKTINELITSAKQATQATRVSKWKEYYNFKKKYLLAANILNKYGTILFNRDIDYGFAITSHKSQGSTYGTVFVDMNDIVFDKNNKPYLNYNEVLHRLYVACSRAEHQLIIKFNQKK